MGSLAKFRKRQTFPMLPFCSKSDLKNLAVSMFTWTHNREGWADPVPPPLGHLPWGHCCPNHHWGDPGVDRAELVLGPVLVGSPQTPECQASPGRALLSAIPPSGPAAPH